MNKSSSHSSFFNIFTPNAKACVDFRANSFKSLIMETQVHLSKPDIELLIVQEKHGYSIFLRSSHHGHPFNQKSLVVSTTMVSCRFRTLLKKNCHLVIFEAKIICG